MGCLFILLVNVFLLALFFIKPQNKKKNACTKLHKRLFLAHSENNLGNVSHSVGRAATRKADESAN